MSEEVKRPDYLKAVETNSEPTIAKPGEFNLDKFRSQTAPNIAGVETLLTALPHHSISQAKDFAAARAMPTLSRNRSGRVSH